MLKSNIGYLIDRSKLKRDYIVKKLNISRNTLTNWSAGRTYPPMDKAHELAKMLEVDLNELYEKTEEN